MAGAGVLLALSAACGATNQTGSAPLPSELPTTESSAEPHLPGESQLPGESPAGAKLVSKVDTSQLPEGYPKKVWTEGDGSRVGLVAQEGGCSKASVEIAEQTEQRVVLNVVESSPAQQQMCTMDIRYPSFTVTLNAPLADRPVTLVYQKRTY
jgi:hypothetical protein